MSMLSPLWCAIGIHCWIDRSAPLEVRRMPSAFGPSGQYYDTGLGRFLGPDGPVETFQPDPFGPNKPRRECVHCGKSQRNYGGAWR